MRMLLRVFVLMLLRILLLWDVGSTNEVKSIVFKLCVSAKKVGSSYEKCKDMMQFLINHQNISIECVSGRDRLDCIDQLARGEVHVALAKTPDDVTYANMVGDNIRTVLELRTRKHQQESEKNRIIALSRNFTRFDGSSIDRQWPFSNYSVCYIASQRFLSAAIVGTFHDQGKSYPCDGKTSEYEYYVSYLNKTFGPSCLPGLWGQPQAQPSQELRSKYGHLCVNCPDKSCDIPDDIDADEIMFTCLQEGDDVAWLTYARARKFFVSDPMMKLNALDFVYICPNLTQFRVSDSDTAPPCDWGGVPWPLFLTTASLPLEQHENLKQQLIVILTTGLPEMPKYLEDVFDTYVRESVPYNDTSFQSTTEYLIRADYKSPSDKFNCNYNITIRICVSTAEEIEKCPRYKMAARSVGLYPTIDCVKADSLRGCTIKIQSGMADVMIADINVVSEDYDKFYNLTPILTEVYDDSLNISSHYLIVALIRADTIVGKLEHLKKMKSCHASHALSDISWYLPIQKLKEKKLISKNVCSFGKELKNIFLNSCVYGDMLNHSNPVWGNPNKRCQPCLLEGKEMCPKKPLDEPVDELAFRCLESGTGDVAFIRIRRGNDANNPWIYPGISRANEDEYRLLCPSGDKWKINLSSKTEEVLCNWGKMPPKMVFTRKDQEPFMIDNLKRVLTDSALLFASSFTPFDLFSQWQGTSNVLFSDETKGLKPYQNNSEDVSSYVGAANEIYQCKESCGCDNVAQYITVISCLLCIKYLF